MNSAKQEFERKVFDEKIFRCHYACILAIKAQISKMIEDCFDTEKGETVDKSRSSKTT